jgi:CRP-like cAMP-binding protein
MLRRRSGASGHDEYLRRLPMFAACDDRHLRSVAAVTDVVDVDAGETVVAQGSMGHEVYVLVSGTAHVERDGNVVATLGAGDYFGELSVLDPGPRNATVTMTSAGRLLCITRPAFHGLLRDIPGFVDTLLLGMAQRLHAADAVTAR